MCGTCNGTTNGTAEAAAPATANGTANGTASNGTSTHGTHPAQPKSSPYQSMKDYLSNVDKYKIIESTLREGEQFANAFFDIETKIKMYDMDDVVRLP